MKSTPKVLKKYHNMKAFSVLCFEFRATETYNQSHNKRRELPKSSSRERMEEIWQRKLESI